MNTDNKIIVCEKLVYLYNNMLNRNNKILNYINSSYSNSSNDKKKNITIYLCYDSSINFTIPNYLIDNNMINNIKQILYKITCYSLCKREIILDECSIDELENVFVYNKNEYLEIIKKNLFLIKKCIYDKVIYDKSLSKTQKIDKIIYINNNY